MPRLTKSLPKYRKHKASGQAFVELSGHRFYLGPHGTQASHGQYDRLVGEWQQNGRRLPTKPDEVITVSELLAAYWKFAEEYYVKDGCKTDEQQGIKVALSFVRRMYGGEAVDAFGPLALKAVRQAFVDTGHCRQYVNQNVGRIKRVFCWGVENEMIPVQTYQALTTVVGLKKGKTEAVDHDPVEPVDDATVEATILHLHHQVIKDMIRIQRLTGCRPGELFLMRPSDIDRSADVWRYVPKTHKTEHRNRSRVIFMGPQAQAILAPYLLRASKSWCFERPRGGQFKRWNYAHHIEKACKRAFPAPKELSVDEKKEWHKRHKWSPNRLRHSAATFIRSRFGLEAAQVTLGHSNAKVTQIYAERDMEKATQVMREVG